MANKKVVRKKSASSKKPQLSIAATRKVRDALENPEANDEVILAGGAPKKVGKAKRVAKVVHLIVSVGDDDRSRSFEDFVKFIQAQLGTTEYGKPGVHSAVTGGHYILDGKVCRPEDYDKRRQNFKPGAQPPSWAGGEKTASVKVATVQRQMDWDIENLSSDEYDRKYKIGKYAPPQETTAEHEARMRRQRAEAQAAKEAELEEFDWDEGDENDDVKMGKVADASASRAIKKLKAKKRVVSTKKKSETGSKPKKIVRVKK